MIFFASWDLQVAKRLVQLFFASWDLQQKVGNFSVAFFFHHLHLQFFWQLIVASFFYNFYLHFFLTTCNFFNNFSSAVLFLQVVFFLANRDFNLHLFVASCTFFLQLATVSCCFWSCTPCVNHMYVACHLRTIVGMSYLRYPAAGHKARTTLTAHERFPFALAVQDKVWWRCAVICRKCSIFASVCHGIDAMSIYTCSRTGTGVLEPGKKSLVSRQGPTW